MKKHKKEKFSPHPEAEQSIKFNGTIFSPLFSSTGIVAHILSPCTKDKRRPASDSQPSAVRTRKGKEQCRKSRRENRRRRLLIGSLSPTTSHPIPLVHLQRINFLGTESAAGIQFRLADPTVRLQRLLGFVDFHRRADNNAGASDAFLRPGGDSA